MTNFIYGTDAMCQISTNYLVLVLYLKNNTQYEFFIVIIVINEKRHMYYYYKKMINTAT